MIARPAVIVHGLEDARAALAPGRPVTLLSARGAALYAGCGWWQALVEAARAEFPATDADDVLDCADAPGRALEALRVGLRNLVLDADCPAFAAVERVAAEVGARILPAVPAALDLAQRGASRRLLAWLSPPGDSEAGM
ncbi:MAG: hypothetical protein ACREFJ_13990 [Acetobacteraceae bacterium]